MKAHRIDWSTATVETNPDLPEPQFLLRVKLEGPTTSAWRETFNQWANVRTSLVEPWGNVDIEGDEIVVDDLEPEREPNFISLLHSYLTGAVVRADRRQPLREELEDDEHPWQPHLSKEPKQRAIELTNYLRALS